MSLKPKSTHLNPPAILYKRYLDISTYFDASYSDKNILYMTSDTLYWFYDKSINNFVEYTQQETHSINAVSITSTTGVYIEGVGIFLYSNGEWELTDTTPNLLYKGNSQTIYKGQKSVFQRKDYFDYTIISDINIGEEQAIKGLITDLESFDIKFSYDDLKIDNEDIVQIDNKLYMVSDLKYKILRLPKPLKYYYCTLTKLKV